MFLNIFKYSVKNILRNKFLSISSVIVLFLLMFFINILLVLHNVSFQLFEVINSKLTISLYLKEDYDFESPEVKDFINDIRNISRDIVLTYKSKQEIYDEMEKIYPDLINIIKTEGILEINNPFSNTILVSSINLDLAEYDAVNKAINDKEKIFENSNSDSDISSTMITDYKGQYSRIESNISTLNILRTGLYIIIGIFLLSIAIIVYSIIGNFIYYYRDEIYITKLVGGSNLFIHGPFIFQGIIYTFLSFIISSPLFVIFINKVSETFGFTSYLEIINQNIYNVFFVELVTFVLIGAISGYLSSRKYVTLNNN